MPASSRLGQGLAVRVPWCGLATLVNRLVRRCPPPQLNPGAGVHPTHREAAEVDRLVGAEGGFDLLA